MKKVISLIVILSITTSAFVVKTSANKEPGDPPTFKIVKAKIINNVAYCPANGDSHCVIFNEPK